ncbi:MAG: hypothetical protein ACOCTU_08120 [Bacteroidota bacterium]
MKRTCSHHTAASLADYSEMVEFKTTKSNPEGMVYEVLPGPVAIDPSKKGTPVFQTTSIKPVDIMNSVWWT